MKETINGMEFEFNCKLRTCVNIRKRFKETYNELVARIDKMSEEEMLIFLYCGIVDPTMSESEFVNHGLDGNMGMGDLIDIVVKYAKQLQYPGLTEDEIEKKLLEKKAEAEKFKN
ncbi:MAG TPA: hypothetical protein PLG34_13145 [Spirochaetota bacterium]|nr:hypothetical protein [Spirochaetota bacterium]